MRLTPLFLGFHMKYEGDIIRPPSEARSLLLQVTVGCSHNKCVFCPSFKEKKFRIKSIDEIHEDIVYASRFRGIERVFLCDGDALIIPQERLVTILRLIRENVRGVKRIGTYANAKSILRKSVDELIQLKELGLGIIYMGVETGNEYLLEKIRKGVTYTQMAKAGRNVKEAGILLSTTVILGLGGEELSRDHAYDTAKILSDIDPEFASALTLMLVPGTPLFEDYKAGRFQPPDKFACLEELAIIVENSQFTHCYFTSNHASNYLPVKAKLPEEKEHTVHMIRSIIKSRSQEFLRPDFLRGL